MSRSPDVHTMFRSRRWLRWLAPAGPMALAATLVIPHAAQAADPTPETHAACYVDVPQVTVTPGFGSSPDTGTGQSGPGGTIRCIGTIRGARVVSDPGPLSVTFTYGTGPLSSLTKGDTCLAGSGDGTVSATVPVLQGQPVILTGPIHFGFLGPIGSYYGHFGEIMFAGIGESLPDLSANPTPNCLTTPITKLSIRGQFGLKNL